MRPPVYSYPPSEFLIKEYLESDESPPRDLPIFYNYICNNLPEGKLLYYNIEQLTRENECNTIKKLWEIGNIEEVWDYSEANCEILRNNNIPCKYIPFTLTKSRLEYYKTLCSVKKEFDIGFCGLISERRQKILEELAKSGLCVLVITNLIDEARDIELAKCKIIINIHYADDYKIFEKSRCARWLELGKIVVSEESLDNDPRAFCFPYNDLVKEAVLLNHAITE